MSRLTVTLNDDLHRALKETAARQGPSIASIIEESLRPRGIQDKASARALVAKARKRARFDPDAALKLAVDETRAARKGSAHRSSSLTPTQWALACSRDPVVARSYWFWTRCSRRNSLRCTH